MKVTQVSDSVRKHKDVFTCAAQTNRFLVQRLRCIAMTHVSFDLGKRLEGLHQLAMRARLTTERNCLGQILMGIGQSILSPSTIRLFC